MLIALYILTFFLVLDCLFLGLLILMQLPKKDAGMSGAAFGGGAVDALIGSGSGNVLTKITKYSAGVFFVLIITLSLLHSNYAQRNVTAVSEQIEAQKKNSPQAVPATSIDLPNVSTSTSAAPVAPISQPVATPVAPAQPPQ